MIDKSGTASPVWSAWFRQLYARVGGSGGASVESVASDLADHISDSTDAHDASAVSNSPSGNLAATNVQAALNELQGDADALDTAVSAAQSDATQALSDASDAQDDIDGHIADSSDAHDASAISYSNSTSGLTATDVQSALDEIDSDVDTLAGASSIPPGATAMWFGSSPPSAWLFLNGATIGNGSSGGTARANADTEDLFTHLWDSLNNTALPIQDSSGAGSTRGASAAADFAANKRLPLPNMTGLVPRMPGTQAVNSRNKVGPTIGLPQEDQMQGHIHGLTSFYNRTSRAGGGAVTVWEDAADPSPPSTDSPSSDGSNGTPRTGAETRAAAFGVNFIIKL